MNSLQKDLILDRIKPSGEEHLENEKIAKRLFRKIRRTAKNLGYKCEVFIGGSFGKGTYLKGNSDVDFFVRFDSKYDDKTLSSILKEILDNTGIKYQTQKGSRDYYSGKYGPKKNSIDFEVVPTRKIKHVHEMVNSTDVSPLHVEFVLNKAKDNPNLTDEIRLAKQFFKSKKLYGAESYIGGFSGHVIDILIIHYGSLENLINEAKNWEDFTLIDVCSHYENREEALGTIESDKKSNLIVIDPIVKERNASRALDFDNYSRFLLIANHTNKLSEKDFEIVKEDYKEKIISHKNFVKENNLHGVLYEIKFKLKNESKDIVGSKLRKLHGKVLTYLTSYDFVLFQDEFFIDIDRGVCLFIFSFEKVNLPKLKKVFGPKTYMTSAISKFLEKRETSFIENGRVCSYEERSVTKLREIIKLDKEDLEKMLSRNIDFVKSIKVRK